MSVTTIVAFGNRSSIGSVLLPKPQQNSTISRGSLAPTRRAAVAIGEHQ